MLVLLLVACNNNNDPTNTLTGEVLNVDKSYIGVECSDEAKGNQQPQSSKMYVCTVRITDDTIFSNGNMEDLSDDSKVKVKLTKKMDIDTQKKSSLNVTAKEIIIK
ncbi:hypothetical protein GLW08_04920 [Pontibacillus yanchengensis]|uniref:Uncharacterized protein n=2 Tax=Pontibacillus yanchengensis TaxID=462910 RepID=A0ACC7VCG3_9BACI|nr:hypothetical protein [Pontibacillus yanchengensis]MYL32096.1 hypothetical protein [Pontibacillus yanchengensis]MYL52676.1 hypothetical protein [Pontibacillus yanchengensis]